MKLLRVPGGFRLAGVHCGIKRNATRNDLSLVVCDRAASAAGVYTQNRVCAAPVVFNRQRTPSEDVRAVVINSGNANACTGERGMKDVQTMARLAAQSCGAREDQVLVLSTGIIGEPLPMEKISAGISDASNQLGVDEAHLVAAARGMMTTDTQHKISSRQVDCNGHKVQVTGMAKGAGMIGPRMATMLAVIMTDATLPCDDAQRLLSQTVDTTFNCISVEGHTSTNDTVLLLASGAAGGPPLRAEDLGKLQSTVHDVCVELARAIPADGEGATHLIEIDVSGCSSSDAARQIARNVANSLLVKTAVAGADPNWGRIVSAVGFAEVPFDPLGLNVSINGTCVFRGGAPAAFDAAKLSRSIRENHQTSIAIELSGGDQGTRFWTSDLTARYVQINADYHT